MGVPTQSTTIASNAVIGIMAPQPLAQVAVLFGDAQMQVMPATSTEPRRASSLPVPLSAAFSCTGLQVGRVQSPLPCFPSTVLFPGVSLFSSGSHRSGSPPSQILRRRYAILNCIPVAYGFASRLPRLHGFRAFAYALPSDWRRSFRARGISMPASPIPAFLRGQHRTSQVPC